MTFKGNPKKVANAHNAMQQQQQRNQWLRRQPKTIEHKPIQPTIISFIISVDDAKYNDALATLLASTRVKHTPVCQDDPNYTIWEVSLLSASESWKFWKLLAESKIPVSTKMN